MVRSLVGKLYSVEIYRENLTVKNVDLHTLDMHNLDLYSLDLHNLDLHTLDSVHLRERIDWKFVLIEGNLLRTAVGSQGNQHRGILL